MAQYNSPFPGVEVDDAVAKRHAQNTDTKLDEGGANEVSAAQVKGAVDKSHVQGTDQTLDAGGPNEVTAADAADAVAKRHAQGTDQVLDEGGPNEVTAATLADLASAERREQFFQTVLQPVGVNTPPDVLYWPTPYRAVEMDATAVRAGSDATFFDRFGVLQNADPDTFRRDFDPATGAFKGALAEPQRTNLLLRSEDFGNAVWLKEDSTITANAAVAPDGETTADLLVEGTGSGQKVVRVPRTFVDGTHSFSVFVKQAVGNRRFYVRVRDAFTSGTTYANWTVDLSALTSAGAGGTLTATPAGNGWVRVSVVFDMTAGTRNLFFGVADGANAFYTGDGTSGIYIWGAQLEQAAFPSSYIKTEATTVTRPADTLTIPQVGDRRRGFICWQGVMRFDPGVSGSSLAQVRRFPFGRLSNNHCLQLGGNNRCWARNTTSTAIADIGPTQTTPFSGRIVRAAMWWDSDLNVFGVSHDGLSAVNNTEIVGIPENNPIHFGQSDFVLEGSSHTDWIFISYNIPPIAQIEALTGAVL